MIKKIRFVKNTFNLNLIFNDYRKYDCNIYYYIDYYQYNHYDNVCNSYVIIVNMIIIIKIIMITEI